jgi:hypothetical protein
VYDDETLLLLLKVLDILFVLSQHGSDDALHLFNILWTRLFEQLESRWREPR